MTILEHLFSVLLLGMIIFYSYQLKRNSDEYWEENARFNLTLVISIVANVVMLVSVLVIISNPLLLASIAVGGVGGAILVVSA